MKKTIAKIKLKAKLKSLARFLKKKKGEDANQQS